MKPFYNVWAYAPGIQRRWIHPSNLKTNGRGGYTESWAADYTAGPTYVPIKWFYR
jgi:hypothetical protein